MFRVFWRFGQLNQISRMRNVQCVGYSTEKRMKPRNYWKDLNNQKTFLMELENHLDLKKPEDWYKLQRKDFVDNGGVGIIKEYSSCFDMLQTHYPDISWNPILFTWKPNGFWDSVENQRLFFDAVGKKNNFISHDDWKSKGCKAVKSESGSSTLLRRYSSFHEALETIYPEIEWEIKSDGRYPKNYWASIENQKNQLEKIKDIKGLKCNSEWKNITVAEFRSFEGGSAILQYYDSFFDMLKTIYPEYDWNMFSDVQRVSRGFWKSKENQKKFMDEVSNRLGHTCLDDWNSVTIEQFQKQGGYQLLNIYGSLSNILEELYPEHEWNNILNKNRTPTNYFLDIENQKAYLTSLEEKFNIKDIDDWKNISREQIMNEKGGACLLRIYGTTFNLLKEMYPNHEWKATDFTRAPRLYWKDIKNQREFFDDLAKKFNITNPKDWSNVSYRDVVNAGGGRLLRYYSSIYEALKSIYPEYEWNAIELRSRVPNFYWDNTDNIIEFIESLREKFKVLTDDDWYRISNEQIQLSGGRSLIMKYGSFYKLLKSIYPEKKWKKSKFQNRNKRSSQRWMFLQIKKLFPKYEVIEEFLHEELSRVSGRAIEIDCFIPSLQIGFEFQGRHHYEERPALGSLDMYQKRDAEKQELCKDNNIALVLVPYWWDNTEEGLKKLIKEQYPSINV